MQTLHNPLPDKYSSRGRVISKSHQHQDMWIVDTSDGKFYTLTASQSEMRILNPPDQVDKRITKRLQNK